VVGLDNLDVVLITENAGGLFHEAEQHVHRSTEIGREDTRYGVDGRLELGEFLPVHASGADNESATVMGTDSSVLERCRRRCKGDYDIRSPYYRCQISGDVTRRRRAADQFR